MPAPNPAIAVVDDDPSWREALTGLIRSFGFPVSAFDSASAFLGDRHGSAAKCLVLDVNMPDMTGLELQRRLAVSGRRTPIIFVTSCVDDRVHARALNAGALAVLEKPCDQGVLLKHLKLALHILP